MKVHLRDADGSNSRQRVAGSPHRPIAEEAGPGEQDDQGKQASHAGQAGRWGTGLAAEPTAASSAPLRLALRGELIRDGGDGRATPAATARLIAHPPEGWPGEPPTQSLRLLSSVTAPPRNDGVYYRVCCQLKRHLRDPRKPLIVVIAESPDSELCQQAAAAYGRSLPLRNAADLVLAVTGPAALNGAKLDELGTDQAEDRRERVKPLLFAIDRYDLYGNAAIYYPREPCEEVTELLRVARDRRGVMLGTGSEVVAGASGGEWLPSEAWAADEWGGTSPAPSLALELLSSDLGVPVVSADADDLADLCGSILVDSESWSELSRETQQMAADRRWQICRSGYSSLGRRLLESRRRRGSRPSGGRFPLAGKIPPSPATSHKVSASGTKVSVVDTGAVAAG